MYTRLIERSLIFLDCDIEKDVLKDFNSDELFLTISVIFRHARIHINCMLSSLGLEGCSPPHLMALHNHPGTGQNALACYLKMDKGSIAKAVKSLIDKGFVYREDGAEYNRRDNLYLTRKGEETIPVLNKIRADFETSVTREMTKSEIRTLKSLLDKAVNNILTESRCRK